MARGQHPDISLPQYDKWFHDHEPGTDQDFWYDPERHGDLGAALQRYPRGLMLDKENVPSQPLPGTQIYRIPWTDDGRHIILPLDESIPVS
jgi:hypothetical protein